MQSCRPLASIGLASNSVEDGWMAYLYMAQSLYDKATAFASAIDFITAGQAKPAGTFLTGQYSRVTATDVLYFVGTQAN